MPVIPRQEPELQEPESVAAVRAGVMVPSLDSMRLDETPGQRRRISASVTMRSIGMSKGCG
jgi:hypothetical protein